MVEGSGFENRRRGNSTGGSNPSSSGKPCTAGTADGASPTRWRSGTYDPPASRCIDVRGRRDNGCSRLSGCCTGLV